jgi:hypothetical protein
VLGGFQFVRSSLGLRFPWESWAKIGAASAAMALALWLMLRWDHPAFALLSPWQDTLQGWIGRRLDLFFGYRTVRLICSGTVCLALYAGILILIARPRPEDARIFRALERRLPFALKVPVPGFLRRRLSHASRLH